MKLPGWEKVASAEEYRQMIEAEYYRLKDKHETKPEPTMGLEEVKLRLFLSLLDKPIVQDNAPGVDSAQVGAR
jgi:hypothetical protein